MNLQTDDGIRGALHEIASWSSPDNQLVRSTDPGLDGPTRGSRSGLVALSLLIAVAVGLAAIVVRQPESTIDAVDEIGPELSLATAVDHCLDVDTEFDLAQLRSSGTLHLLGQTSDDPGDPFPQDRVYLVISGESLHAACGLRRSSSSSSSSNNQHWVSVTSFIETNQGPVGDNALSLETTIELRGRVYVVGQVGDSVTTVRVQTADGQARDGETEAQIDNGWWGSSFANNDGILGGFPDFEVVWTTSSGASTTAHSDELQPTGPWLLCARDESCRTARWAELHELAKGLDDAEQATILEDGEVSEEEYRDALRRWGDCIAESTGAQVVYDDDGLFTIEGESTNEAFEICQARHASLVTEAVGLQGVSPRD